MNIILIIIGCGIIHNILIRLFLCKVTHVKFIYDRMDILAVFIPFLMSFLIVFAQYDGSTLLGQKLRISKYEYGFDRLAKMLYNS